LSAFVTGIQIQDHFSSVVYDIGNALGFAVSAMVNFQDAMQTNLDMSSIEEVGIRAESATAALNELNAASQTMAAPELMQRPINDTAAENVDGGIQTGLNDTWGIGSGGLEEFERIPSLISQIKTDLQNAATETMSSVTQSLDDIANSQAFQSMVNTALQSLSILANSEVMQIFMERIQQLVNTLNESGLFQIFVDNAVIAFQGLIGIASGAVGLLENMAGFIAEHWSILAPIIYGVVTALAAYAVIAGIVAVMNGILAISHAAKAAAETMASGVTFLATVQQHGLNAALMACPITWIILMVIALIAVIFAVCAAIAKFTGAASSGFGIILGCVFVANAAFLNFGMLLSNIALGIWEAMKALCSNMVTAFHNSIVFVKSGFYSLLSVALSVVARICEALNKLPFVSFDYSGIENAASDFAEKAREEAASKKEYTSVSDAFQQGFHTHEVFKDGWASDAFNAGAKVGDAFSNKVSDFFSGLSGGSEENSWEKYRNEIPDNSSGNGFHMDGSAAQTAVNTGQTAENTAVIADALDITNEQLKYLRDIAERDTVNRFTTASIKVEMTNQNNINSGMDIDGVVNGLALAVSDAMSQAAEGVHI
jgi:hypothetical protein